MRWANADPRSPRFKNVLSQSERLNGAFAQLSLFEELRMAPFGPPAARRLEQPYTIAPHRLGVDD